MAAEKTPTPQRQAPPSTAGRLVRLVLAVLALLLLSETLWLWQTWPVRELLQPPPSSTPVASRQ
jgi:hypothetical protein